MTTYDRMNQPEAQNLSLDAAMNIAVSHHREGKLQDAEKYYRAVLAAVPNHATANHNLGVLAQQLGKPALALPFFEAAIKADPSNKQYPISCAEALLATGDAARAAQVLKGAAPYGEGGLAVRAEQLYRNALAALQPPSADIERLIGMFQSGRHAELEVEAQALIARFPSHGTLWKLLCAALQTQGKDVLAALERATEVMPGDAELQCNLGAAQAAASRFEQAAGSYRRAIALQPAYVDAHNNLGIALRNLGDLEGALASYAFALELKPDHADSHSNMGVVLRDLGRFEEAADSFRKAGKLKPENAKIHNNLAAALQNVGQLAESLASSERVLELEPGNLDALSRILYTNNFFVSKTPAETLAEARDYGRLVAQSAQAFGSWNGTRDAERTLRIGVVSGDLRDHPVGYFVESVFCRLANHAAARLEIVAYANHATDDAVAARIRSCCNAWHVVADLDDRQTASLIRGHAIDILIDLSGHTAENRLPVFAWKPAPVQATWLGYFATTGVQAIDYLIADPWTVPADEDEAFSETVWRLPETRLCFTPPAQDVPVMPVPALAAGHVTFGCFNKLPKMSDAVVAIWARILLAVPRSRLLLKATMLKSEAQKRAVQERFARHGIESGRLELEGPSSREAYLAAYGRIDIALDPFPFTGGTTTAEALWMGVPVLTLAGERFIARQGAGLLANAGLPDWIATDIDDYVAKAVCFAQDLPALARLRDSLRSRLLASPLCDAPRFSLHFEAMLRDMWRQWCLREAGHAR